MAKNLRIGGVVKAQRQVELLMAAGDEASMARAQETATRIAADVRRICDEENLAPEELPLPTRKAYAFLLQAAAGGSLTMARADAALQTRPKRPQRTTISAEAVREEAWELGRLMWRRRLDLLRDRDLLADLATRVRHVVTKLEATGHERMDFAPPAAPLGSWLRFLLQSDHLRLAIKALERAERAAQQVLPKGQSCPEIIWMPPGEEPVTIDAGPPRSLLVSFDFFNASKKNWKSVFGLYLQGDNPGFLDEILTFLESEACDQYRRLFSPPTRDAGHDEDEYDDDAQVYDDDLDDSEEPAPPKDDRFLQKRLEEAKENLRTAKLLPRETWVGGYFRLPSFAHDGATVIRAHQILFASVRVRKVHPGKLEARDRLTIDDVILTLGDLAQGRGELVAGRPARLVVNDADLAAGLQSILAGSGTTVVFEARPQLLADIEQFFIEAHRKSHGLPVLPDHLSVKGMTRDHIRAFAEAAFALRKAAPWRHVCAEDLIEISPRIMDMRYLRVLGNSGLEEGLIICDSDHPSHDDGFISVNFEYPENAPLCDVDLFDEERLPIHEGQYPVLLHSQGQRFRRLSPQNLALVVGLMRALGTTTEAEFDRGAWQRTVESHTGSFEFSFRIPSLLRWREDRREGRPRDPKRSLESQKLAIGRLLKSGMNVEGLNELIARRGGDLSAEAPAMTPEEQAQDLALEAGEHEGLIQLELAREAFALDPNCSEAHMVRARFLIGSSPTEALPHYERAMTCGRARLSDPDFKEFEGCLWRFVPARAFLSAKHGLAACLQRLRRFDEAARHFEELLAFTRDDHQGVRHELAATYIDLRNFGALEKLLRDFDENFGCHFDWVRALAFFSQEGASNAARSALRRARKANKHVEGRLLNRNRLPLAAPPWTPGQESEGETIAIILRDTWHRVPGASRWLAEER